MAERNRVLQENQRNWYDRLNRLLRKSQPQCLSQFHYMYLKEKWSKSGQFRRH